MKRNKKVALVVEKSCEGSLYGRMTINRNLLVAAAPTLEALKKEMAKLALDCEQVAIGPPEIFYDLTSFFHQYKVSISEIAVRVGINASLMRQYASGVKFPSADRVHAIEKAVHAYAKELSQVKLAKTGSQKRQLASA